MLDIVKGKQPQHIKLVHKTSNLEDSLVVEDLFGTEEESSSLQYIYVPSRFAKNDANYPFCSEIIQYPTNSFYPSRKRW